eukprot:CAMPEP_0174255228 /NCGR_PEP_ID=MMETSP0439-20130205/4563_1 /TAXON_ID=0 /ORGANISM="Stereomyxa ramosa, Strain Chinc5" /LENGTH=342 /DNA_ID=CAMNT_0015337307 /DNA_START=1 /DNA_END=1026 /DNA_ORIENTATION=-
MEYITLPQTDLRVSRICLGTWQFSGKGDNTWDEIPQDTANEIVQTALDNGINFFDTAEAYGRHNAEKVLGEALKGRRQEAVIASKFGLHVGESAKVYSYDDILSALDESLGALGTDYIDLYQVHWRLNVESHESTVAALKDAQKQGKIRYFSFCNYGVESIQDWVDHGGPCVANQLPYNLLWRAIEDSIIPKCVEHNITVLCYSPLQQGLLTGKFTCPEDVPEGRRRTRHFAGDSTSLSRHGQAGLEKETFETLHNLRQLCSDFLDKKGEGENKEIEKTMGKLAIRWLLEQKGVGCVIMGATSKEQVLSNCDIPAFDEHTLLLSSQLTDDLRIALGPNPDMW